MNLLSELQLEEQRLSEIAKQKSRALAQAPEEILIATSSHGCAQYYVRKPHGEKRYLKKEEHGIAKQLAQRDYDRKVLALATKEIKNLKTLIKIMQGQEEALYDNLPKSRKCLVKPVTLPIDEFIKQWQSVQYKGKQFADGSAEIYTERGERVRSKSEKIIADKLYSMGVPYRYEYPLQLNGFGTIYPDFCILNKTTRQEYYWEHLGMMDKPEYCSSAIKKIETLMKNGFWPGEKIILTYETSEKPLDTNLLAGIVRKYGL